ncbi:uncharacterized protein [Centruroides vittatus]|uniref:uncharacterized protein isoform X2 n=1 Tax=Centruroides vittatus TaxID=120091 RepID=UPI003510CB3D
MSFMVYGMYASILIFLAFRTVLCGPATWTPGFFRIRPWEDNNKFSVTKGQINILCALFGDKIEECRQNSKIYPEDILDIDELGKREKMRGVDLPIIPCEGSSPFCKLSLASDSSRANMEKKQQRDNFYSGW